MQGVRIRSTLDRFARLGSCAVLAGVFALAHCGSFDEAKVATDAGSVDSGGGANPLDGGPMADGPPMPSTDGGPDGAFGGCALALVDDFERSTVANALWDGTRTTGGVLLSLDANDPHHGGASLRVDVPGGSGSGFFYKTLGNRSRVRFELAVKTPPSVARTISVGTIELDNGGTHHLALYLVADTGRIELREQRFDVTPTVVTPHDLGVDKGGWHTYAMTLDLSTTAPHARVEIDGKAAFDDKLAYAFVPASVAIHAGVGDADMGQATMLWFDDVAVCSDP